MNLNVFEPRRRGAAASSAPSPSAPRRRRAYGIALVLIVVALSGTMIGLSVDRLIFGQRRVVQLADRRAARAALNAAADSLAATAPAWIGQPTMSATYVIADYEVFVELVAVAAHAALPMSDHLAYRGVRMRTRPLALPAGHAGARRQRVYGLERTYIAAAAEGQPLMLLLVEERLNQLSPRRADEPAGAPPAPRSTPTSTPPPRPRRGVVPPVSSVSPDVIRKSRLALLLHEAELLAPNTFKRVMLGLGVESKTLGQLLNEEISGETLKHLLTMDINPFGRRMRHPVAEDLHLSHPVRITMPEISAIIRHYHPDPHDLLDFLVRTGVLDNHRADEIASRSKDDEALTRNILEERLLSPGILSHLMEDARLNERTQLNRAQVASDILLHNDLVGPEEIADVFESSARLAEKPYEHLNPIISQSELSDRLMSGLFLPSIELTDENLVAGYADMFPVDMMRRLGFLPIALEENHLTFVVGDMLDLSVADAVAMLTGYTISLVEATPEALEGTMLAAMPDARLREGNLPAIPTDEVAELIGPADMPEEVFVPGASAIELARQILERAVASRATDIHIERVGRTMRVRFRIDGYLQQAMEVPETMQDSLIARFKVQANMDVTERRRPQDGHFTVEDRNLRFDFRLGTLPTQTGEKLVIRILGSTAILLGLNELGLDPEDRARVERVARRKYGLILVTGPTGSGKTTTLYTLLSMLNSIDRNVITIEDPVEYKLDGISQVQVDRNIGIEFAEGLRAALRQDPDIIMVGEIRDPETARIAVRASLTGHVVFSTLHTNNSLGAISTLRYMGVQSYLIASSMSLVVAQRLVRRICSHCGAPTTPDPTVLRDLGIPPDHPGNYRLGPGCKSCAFTGYRGRTGVYEVLEIEENLRRAIIEERDELYLRDVAFENGFRTLQQACASKVTEGSVSAEEGLRECFLLS